MTWYKEFVKKSKNTKEVIVIQGSPSINSTELMEREAFDYNKILQNKNLSSFFKDTPSVNFIRTPIVNRHAAEEAEEIIRNSTADIIQVIIDEAQIGSQLNQKMDKFLSELSKFCKHYGKEFQQMEVSATLPASVDLFLREIITPHASLFYQPPPEKYEFATEVGRGARYYLPSDLNQMILDFSKKILNDKKPGYGMVFLGKSKNDQNISNFKNLMDLAIRECSETNYTLKCHAPKDRKDKEKLREHLYEPNTINLISLNCNTKKYVSSFFTNKNSINKKHFDEPAEKFPSKVIFFIKDMFAESDRIEASNISAVLDIKPRGSTGEQNAAQQTLGRFSGIDKTNSRPDFQFFTDKKELYEKVIGGFKTLEKAYSSEKSLEVQESLSSFQKNNQNLTSSTTKNRKVLTTDSVKLSYVVIKQPGDIDLKDTDKVKRYLRDYLNNHGITKNLADIAFKNYSSTQDNMNSQFFMSHFENYEVAKSSLRKYETKGTQQTFLEREIVAPSRLMSVRSSQRSAIGKSVFCFSTQQRDGLVVYFLPEEIINEKYTTTQAVKETTICKVY